MQKVLRYLAFFVLLILIIAIDSAFLPALGGYFAQINIALVVGLFLVVIVNEKVALLVYLLGSLISVLTTFSMTITPILIGGAVLIFVNWLFESFFTNRSYYTLIALGLIGWIIYYLSFIVVVVSVGLFNSDLLRPDITSAWVVGIAISGIISVLFWTLGYVLTNYMSIRFKSYFIVPNR